MKAFFDQGNGDIFKDALIMQLEKVRVKLKMFLLVSRIVGNFLNVLISLSHMHTLLLLCALFYTIFVGWILMNDLQVEN